MIGSSRFALDGMRFLVRNAFFGKCMWNFYGDKDDLNKCARV